MKYKILLVVFTAALISGCSTAYQAGQTPDDVYYSPARETVARTEKNEERRTERYQQYISSEDDNYLRRKIQNRSRWSAIDDFDYWYDPSYSSYYSYRSLGYNPYLYNNWYGYNRPIWDRYYFHGWYGAYSPTFNTGYYGGGYYGQPVYVVKNPLQPTRSNNDVGRPSLGGYNNNSYSNGNRTGFGEMLKRAITTPSGNSAYSNSNSNSGYSSNSSSSRTTTYEAPSRSYNPPASSSSSSGSSSSSSGTSSSGSVTRPPR